MRLFFRQIDLTLKLAFLTMTLTLQGCLVDGETKIENCVQSLQLVEENTTATPTSVSSLKMAYRISLQQPTTVTRLMLKGIIAAGTFAQLSIYVGPPQSNPESGTLMGTSDARTTTGATSLAQVWFNLDQPISLPMIENQTQDSYWFVFSVGGSSSLDYGDVYGSLLRSGFSEKLGSSWALANTAGPSFGIEGRLACE